MTARSDEMRPRRIVFLLTGLSAGGAEKTINLLARHRAGMGDDVTVLAFHSEADGSYFPYPREITLKMFEPSDHKGRSLLRTMRRFVWLRRQLAEIRPDLLVSFLSKNNVLSILAGRITSVPVIVSERNNPEIQFRGSSWGQAHAALTPLSVRLVMLTERSFGRLSERRRRNAVVIHNPCSLPEGITPAPGDGQRIVAVGRLTPQKGFDLLISAFAQITSRFPQASLTIFGEGTERPALEKQVADLGLNDRVRLPGVTSRPGIWIEQADIFAFSSRFEGFGNVLVEAVAAGLPCVSFDCDFGPETILDSGRGGILVPLGDVQAFADALAQVLKDNVLRDGLQVRARETALRFEPDKVLAQWDAEIAATRKPVESQ